MYREGGAGHVEEEHPPYLDAKRIHLVREVKELVKTAPDSTIKALLTNVREFRKIPREKKDE